MRRPFSNTCTSAGTSRRIHPAAADFCVPPMDTTSEAVRPLFDEDALGQRADVVLHDDGVRAGGEVGDAHRRTSDVPAVNGDRCADRIRSHQELAAGLRRLSELEVLRHLPAGGQRDRNTTPLGGRAKLDDVLARRQLDAERRDAMRGAVHEHGNARRRCADRERARRRRARWAEVQHGEDDPERDQSSGGGDQNPETMRGENGRRAAAILRVAQDRAGRSRLG